jgi:hypothetical protein
LEFDVSRQELHSARENPNIAAEVITELEEECTKRKQKYEQLKEDVRVNYKGSESEQNKRNETHF